MYRWLGDLNVFFFLCSVFERIWNLFTSLSFLLPKKKSLVAGGSTVRLPGLNLSGVDSSTDLTNLSLRATTRSCTQTHNWWTHPTLINPSTPRNEKSRGHNKLFLSRARSPIPWSHFIFVPVQTAVWWRGQVTKSGHDRCTRGETNCSDLLNSKRLRYIEYKLLFSQSWGSSLIFFIYKQTNKQTLQYIVKVHWLPGLTPAPLVALWPPQSVHCLSSLLCRKPKTFYSLTDWDKWAGNRLKDEQGIKEDLKKIENIDDNDNNTKKTKCSLEDNLKVFGIISEQGKGLLVILIMDGP